MPAERMRVGHREAVERDIQSQIDEMNTPFRLYVDGKSEGTIRRGDVWHNTYVKSKLQEGKQVIVNEKKKEVIIANHGENCLGCGDKLNREDEVAMRFQRCRHCLGGH